MNEDLKTLLIFRMHWVRVWIVEEDGDKIPWLHNQNDLRESNSVARVWITIRRWTTILRLEG